MKLIGSLPASLLFRTSKSRQAGRRPVELCLTENGPSRALRLGVDLSAARSSIRLPAMVPVLSALVMALSALVGMSAAEDEQSRAPGPVDRGEMRVRVDSLRALADQDSLNFDLRFELANSYYDLGVLPSAVLQYRKAVALDSTSLKAWVNLGVAQNEMGLSEDALESYDRALAIDPTDNKALCNKGLAYYGLRKYFEAVNLYRKALELYPESVEAHYNLGVAFADAQMYREAINEWTQVARIAPGTEAARAATANVDVIREMVRLQGRTPPE